MLELARLSAMVHKVHGTDHRSWPTAAESLEMVTRDASICTGHGERLGRIEPGAHGDLLLIDGRSQTFTPVNDPIRQFVYGGDQRDVRAVVVAGEVVAEHGSLTRVDERQILEQARRHAESEAELLAALAGAGVGELETLVDGVWRRAEQYDSPVDAYIPS